MSTQKIHVDVIHYHLVVVPLWIYFTNHIAVNIVQNKYYAVE
jgi:hypothetical protein